MTRLEKIHMTNALSEDLVRLLMCKEVGAEVGKLLSQMPEDEVLEAVSNCREEDFDAGIENMHRLIASFKDGGMPQYMQTSASIQEETDAESLKRVQIATTRVSAVYMKHMERILG